MQTYLVGGAVRDALLGLPVGERDWVVVGATPQQLLDLGYTQVGKDFPVFLHPVTREEYALARTERKTGPGYKGFSVHAAPEVTLQDDLRRRDLTINAIAQAEDGQLIDPFNGRADLEAGRLRHVSPAFAEDPVRILRLARFAARFARWGFRVAHATHALMRGMVAAGEVDALVPERVWKELERALGETSPARFFQVLQSCGALERLFPELVELFDPAGHAEPHPGLPPGEGRGGGKGEWVLQRVAQLSPLPRVRLAALLSLLGADGQTQLNRLATRLRLPNDYRELASLGLRYATAPPAPDDPAALLALLEHADAFRRPPRFAEFLLIAQAVNPAWPVDAVRAALETAAQVQARELAAAGWQGPALGAELQRRRLRAIAAQNTPS